MINDDQTETKNVLVLLMNRSITHLDQTPQKEVPAVKKGKTTLNQTLYMN